MLFRRNRCRKFSFKLAQVMISISILMFLSFVLLNSLTISCNISPSDAVNPFQKSKSLLYQNQILLNFRHRKLLKYLLQLPTKSQLTIFTFHFVPPSSDKRHLTTFQDSGFNKQLIFPSSAFTFVE